MAPGEGRAPAVQVPSSAQIVLDNVFLIHPDGPCRTAEPLKGFTVPLIAMKGRRVSDETVRLIRELRRRGLSLRKIAQRAKISKTSVYRLTKGISWEQHPVQSELVQVGRILERERCEHAVRPMAVPEPEVPQSRMEAVSEDESEIDQAEAYLMRHRNLSLIYEIIDLENRLDSLKSDDPLEEYRRRRKKSLSGIAVLNGFWNKRRSS